jgi:hypothetical protein
MNRNSSRARLLFLFLAMAGLFLARASAQEVVIAVVGPWGYVTDPQDSSSIYLIAPIANHELHVGPGLAYQNWDIANAGFVKLPGAVYTVDVPKPTCAYKTFTGKLYQIPPAGVGAINASSQIAATGQRFAIHLPKPCFYEQYDTSSMISSSSAITDTSGDTQWTTEMALHYTVDPSFVIAHFTTTSTDDTGTSLSWPVKFTKDTPTAPASISITMGTPMGTPDPNCDQDSAAFFDSELSFWGQSQLYRVFPGIGGNLQQGSYNLSLCSQKPGLVPPQPGSIHQGQRKSARAEVQVHRLLPGRTDCHAPQLNINGTVK